MSKRVRKRKPSPWEIIAITRSPARRYGVVYAESEQHAMAKAIEQFHITKSHEQKKAHGAAATVIASRDLLRITHQ
jgi:hypothetical protein